MQHAYSLNVVMHTDQTEEIGEKSSMEVVHEKQKNIEEQGLSADDFKSYARTYD